MWQQALGYQPHVLKGHTGGVCAIAFAPRSPLSQVFASGSQDQTIRLWLLTTQTSPLDDRLEPSPLVTAQHLKTLNGHTNWIRCLAFSPDGTLLASGGSDGIVMLWNAHTGDRVHLFQAHSSLVLTVAFSPNESVLASSGGDGIIKLWDLSVLQRQEAEGRRQKAEGRIHSKLWDRSALRSEESFKTQNSLAKRRKALLKTQNSSLPLLQSLHGHQNWVRFLAYSPDGTLLASCSQDGTVKLWNASTGSMTALKKSDGDGIQEILTQERWSESSDEYIDQSIDNFAEQPDRDRSPSAPSSSVCLETLRVQRPYENANITGVTGLTAAQKGTLKLLGAIEVPAESPTLPDTPVAFS